MEDFVESQFGFVQYGLALAVPAVLAAIVNLGCGKKRDAPNAGSRPGLDRSKKDASKSAKGAASKSGKSKRSASKSASKKSSKDLKSKKSLKDKSGKSSKSKKSKSSKGSKSSKSKKSKREAKQQKSGQSGSDTAKLPSSGRLAVEVEKNAANKVAIHAGAVAAHDNSLKSAATQRSASISMKQPPSGGAVDVNFNGTTALVAVAGDSTRELKMEPAELRWSSAGGMQKISLVNQSAERQAIKVKCSDNNVYRVNPVYAIVEPGQTLNVDVMRQNGSNKVDKIVFVTARAGLEENPKNLFKPGTQSAMMVLPLLATSTAASANNQPALAAAN